MKQRFLLTALLVYAAFSAAAQGGQSAEIGLWPNIMPGFKGTGGLVIERVTEQGDHVITNIHRPTITPYLPPAANNTGVAVIIAPGGGHSELWITHEGANPAQWFQQHGIAAFVLKYRLAKQKNSTYTVDGDELGDMQQAIKVVKSRAKEWGIDTGKVGVMGFSAGGELAALAGMRFTAGNAGAANTVDSENDRPAFQVLMYPGNISLFTVAKNAPPVFIAGGNDDRPDISAGMAELYLKYKQMQVPAELHIYAKVGHGFGIRPTNTGAVTLWPQQVMLWLMDMGILKNDKP